jgi:hypothetical protein
MESVRENRFNQYFIEMSQSMIIDIPLPRPLECQKGNCNRHDLFSTELGSKSKLAKASKRLECKRGAQFNLSEYKFQ